MSQLLGGHAENPNSNRNKRKYKKGVVDKNSQQGSRDTSPESSIRPTNNQNKKSRIEDENDMVVDSLSNFLEGQNISKSDENFLKEFSRNFYRKIIDIK